MIHPPPPSIITLLPAEDWQPISLKFVPFQLTHTESVCLPQPHTLTPPHTPSHTCTLTRSHVPRVFVGGRSESVFLLPGDDLKVHLYRETFLPEDQQVPTQSLSQPVSLAPSLPPSLPPPAAVLPGGELRVVISGSAGATQQCDLHGPAGGRPAPAERCGLPERLPPVLRGQAQRQQLSHCYSWGAGDVLMYARCGGLLEHNDDRWTHHFSEAVHY